MTVIGQLNMLESAGLIRLAQFEPDLEYLFRHALVQDAAYASLLDTDRRRLHRLVGEAVELLYADRLEEYAAMLARHFARAGDDQHALEYFVCAGDAALAAYANQEAESQYRSALALACSEAQRATLLAGLGEALYRQSHFEEALHTWREAIALCQALGDRDGVARLYARAARVAWYAGDTPQGLRLALEGMDAVAGAPESPDLARLVHEAGRAYHFNGLPDQALPLCRQALDMAERLGAVDVQADALTTMGVLPNQTNEEVLAALTRAVELSESAGLLDIAGRAHHNLGVMTDDILSDRQAAHQHFLRAAEIGHQRGVVSEEFISRFSAVGVLYRGGDLATIEAALAELEDLVCAMPDPEAARFDLCVLRAGLSWLRGELTEALQMMRTSLVEARRRGNLQMLLAIATELAWELLEINRWLEVDDWSEAEAALDEAIALSDRGIGRPVWPRCLLSMVRVRQGRLDAARRLLGEAREQAAVHPSPWVETSLKMVEGELAIAEGRWSEALAAAEAIASFHASRGNRYAWVHAMGIWAELHIRRGEPADLERAQALLREARAAYTDMGASGRVAMANTRLDELRSEINARALDLGKVTQELAVAARIQAGLLPEEVPQLPGWQLAAILVPARQTSGDFYDFIPLPGKRLGIVIADVADKGAGAALYMALSRTLIRTYAAAYVDQPALALGVANERILAETHTGMFVTLFYAILDPAPGTLTYCNAGHNPPLLLRAAERGTVQALGRTGLPLGIQEEAAWEQDAVQLEPGDTLVLYTDGVTEAQTRAGAMFGQERLRAAAQAGLGRSAQEIQESLLAAIHQFVGDAPQSDDITVMVIVKG